MRRCPSITALLLIALACSPAAAIGPNNVAVIANTNPALKARSSDPRTMSQAVGRYYCAKRGIPLGNLIEVNLPSGEDVSREEYAKMAATIRGTLVSRLRIDPAGFAKDPIQCLVLCFGVPAKIQGSTTIERAAVDSFLTLLFNADPDLGPGAIDPRMGVPNPYAGKNVDFATFRASAQNRINVRQSTYKMRYLVCRVDAYEDPKVNVPGYGTMPRDVKSMIDRAASANQTGTFILDEAWKAGPAFRNHYGPAESALKRLIAPGLVLRDSQSPVTYLGAKYDGVIGYASFGMHDGDILTGTEWARPRFGWKPGAIAIINESGGGKTVRYAQHAYAYQVQSPAKDPKNPAVGILDGKPVLRVIARFTEGVGTWNLKNYRVSLRSTASPDTEIAYALVGSNGVAEIDLTSQSIKWPTNHQARVRVYYPANDAYHAGEELRNTTLGLSPQTLIWDTKQAGDGIELKVLVARQCSAEYLRDGCSGINAAVTEPYIDFVDANTTLPRYAAGYSWAEAAYMGTLRLGFKALLLGDALMAPYAARPSQQPHKRR